MSIKDFKEIPIVQFEDVVHEYWKKPHTSWLARNIINLWIFAIFLQAILFVITLITLIITNVNFMFLTQIAGIVVGVIMIIATYYEKSFKVTYILGAVLVLLNVIALLLLLF